MKSALATQTRAVSTVVVEEETDIAKLEGSLNKQDKCITKIASGHVHKRKNERHTTKHAICIVVVPRTRCVQGSSVLELSMEMFERRFK